GVQAHSDGRNFILTAQLGLKVPKDAWIEVAGQKGGWEEGKLTILDTSFTHRTGNDSDTEERDVLIIDFWHPELTEGEKAALEFIYDLRNRFESGQVPVRKPRSLETQHSQAQPIVDQAATFAQSANSTQPGVAKFLSNPTQYGFACGEAPGKVTDASINNSAMVIGYTYPAGDEVRTGQLIGKVNRNGVFTGTYNTRSRLGQLQGTITFTFIEDGTATGNYGNASGSTHIFL
ncbi:MAG: aspartyl/asparaginyl beta-hydroxylase domain-containing protein, partial [Cyanobacteria bacterium P01_A01_bin.17]